MELEGPLVIETDGTYPEDYGRFTKHIFGIPWFTMRGRIRNNAYFKAEVEFDEFTSSYDVVGLQLQRSGNKGGVGNAFLRELKLSDFLTMVVLHGINGGDDNDNDLIIAKTDVFRNVPGNETRSWVPVPYLQGLIRESLKSAGIKPRPTPATLEMAAILYEANHVAGSPPVKALEKAFNLPPRTASHWVKLARERGHLDDRI